MATDPLTATILDAARLGVDLFGRPAEFVAVLRRLGYETDPQAVIGQIPGAAEAAALLPLVEEHAGALADGATLGELLAALELLAPIADLVEAITTADFELPTVATADGTTDWDAAAADVAVRLPQLLLFDVIEYRAGWLVALLELLGLVQRSRYHLESAPNGGVAFQSLSLDTAGLGRLVDDPVGHFGELFVPGGALDAERIAGLAAVALGALASARREDADGDYVGRYLGGVRGDDPVRVTRLRFDRPGCPPVLRGIELLIGPHRLGNDGAAPLDALVIAAPRIDIDSPTIALGAGTLMVEVPAPSVGVAIGPDGSLSLVADVSGDLGVGVELAGNEPWRLFGGDSGPRLELGGLFAAARFTPADGDVALTLGLRALALRLDDEGSDSFLANLVAGIAAELDVDITLTGAGITFDADPTLTVRLPVNITIGPLTISAIAASVAPGGGELAIAVVVDAEATIGPLQVSASEVGVAARISSGATGDDFGLRVGFDPPNRVAFAFAASDAISGGGFLDIDHERGRYAGGAALQVIAVGVSAITVIDTKLPGDDDGWAFFASLGIDIPGIPIGFGFTLEGLGGVVALNRRIDAEALALGLRQGAVDAIMFPDDPVRDSAVLIPQIDAYFPIAVGNTVIGPVVEIGWGSPVQLVSAQIGVMISLPQGLIVIMGSLSMALPTADAPLIEINMDSLGVIDLAAGTVTVTASLYDSRLLGVIELSGDMAFHVATRPTPYFALSVGGWHPSFQPPSLLPSVFSNLRRIRAEVALSEAITLSFESYLALTPNTVQFGGRFELVASVKVALSTYRAVGWFGFDVLLVFSPFKLVADVTAGVAVYSGDKELMGVTLGAHVEGPAPWFASGFAQFKFFGIKVTFDFTVGSRAAPELPPLTDVIELIEAQWADAGRWEIERPAGIVAGVLLRQPADDGAADDAGDGAASGGEPLLTPDATLVVRQNVAPLGRTLEQYGTNRIAQGRVDVAAVRIVDALTDAALPGVTGEPVTDWFAPAQFERMNERQRLTAASYEEYQAGVRITTGGVVAGAGVTLPSGHETSLWSAPPPAAPASTPALKRLGRVSDAGATAEWFAVAAIAARRTRRPTVAVPKVAVAPVERRQATGRRTMVVEPMVVEPRVVER